MMNIFSRLREEQKNQQLTAQERYFAILSRIDNSASADDLAELHDVLELTEKSVAEAEADRAKIIDVRAKLAYIAAHVDADAVWDRAHAAYMKSCADRQAATKAANAAVTETHLALDQATTEKTQARDYSRLIEKLRAADPLLVAAVEAAAVEKPKIRSKK